MENFGQMLGDFVQYLVKIELIDANDANELIEGYWETFG